jgi:hypothetical protein
MRRTLVSGGLALGLGFLSVSLGSYSVLAVNVFSNQQSVLGLGVERTLAVSVSFAIVALAAIASSVGVIRAGVVRLTELCFAISLYLFVNAVFAYLTADGGIPDSIEFSAAGTSAAVVGFLLHREGKVSKRLTAVLLLVFGVSDLLRQGTNPSTDAILLSGAVQGSQGFFLSTKELEAIAAALLALGLIVPPKTKRLSSVFAHFGLLAYSSGVTIVCSGLLDKVSGGVSGDASAFILSLPRILGLTLLLVGAIVLVFGSVVSLALGEGIHLWKKQGKAPSN